MAKILIADDHPKNREYLVNLLRHCGHDLLEADDGVAALARVRDGVWGAGASTIGTSSSS